MKSNTNTKSAKAISPSITLRFLSLRDVGLFLGDIGPELQSREDLVDKLEVHLSASIKLFSVPKKVSISLQITYGLKVIENTDEQLMALKYESESDFYVGNFEEVFLKNEDGTFFTYGRISSTLLGICISTVRGVLIEKTANSFLRNFPLPIIDPKTIKTIEGLEIKVQ